MLALVKAAKGVGNLELREVAVPKPGNREVLIEIKAAGVCGTDLHVKHDTFPYWPPVILGHEFSGRVHEIGPGVTDWKVGDRVVGEPHTLACGKCFLCRTGNVQICNSKRSIGWGIDGAFTKFMVMPEHLLHRIPDNLSYEEAAVVEPAANVVKDVLEHAKVEPEDIVVVMGPGPIGLLAAMAARAGGAKKVVITGTPKDEQSRLPVARQLGFTEVLNLAEVNALERVQELTGGRGADLVVDCSGAEPAINMGLDLIRKKGRFCAIGMTGKDRISIAWDKAISKDIDMFFNMSTSYTCWDRAISLIASGKINVKPLITYTEPLTNWEYVFSQLEAQQGLKALFIPS